jgi:hypothetical protein
MTGKKSFTRLTCMAFQLRFSDWQIQAIAHGKIVIVTHFGSGHQMNLYLPVLGICALALGASMLLYPGKKRASAEERLAELAAGAKERYFEERRSLETYGPPKTDRAWRTRGVALVAMGVIQIALSLYRS